MSSPQRRNAQNSQAPPSGKKKINRNWLARQQNSNAPLVILDEQLNILWRNRAFREFRETPGLEYKGRPFFALFSNFTNVTKRQQIDTVLRNPRGGGWQGMAEGRGPKHRLFRVYITVVPLRFKDNGLPLLFVAIVTDLTEIFKNMTRANFDCILQASLLKDEETGNHIKRVNTYSRRLAQAIKGDTRWFDIDDDFIEDMGILAAYHDVGKIGTPEAILHKNGPLTQDEWKVMKEHPVNGALILDGHPNPMAKEIARSHHERWDGSGYPFGLSGEEIPIEGRIVTIADTYDALRTKRPYKPAFTEKKTFSILMNGSDGHFDPGLIDVLKKLRGDFDDIFRRYSK